MYLFIHTMQAVSVTAKTGRLSNVRLMLAHRLQR